MATKAIVYSTANCFECDLVKQMLTKENIEFEVRDVLSSKEYQKTVEGYGFLGVPVTVIGDKAIKGLTPELEELVKSIQE